MVLVKRAIKAVYIWNWDNTYRKIRPSDILWYDNIYAFRDGIYTGTDTAPKTEKIVNLSNIYGAHYDRVYDVLYVITSTEFWYINDSLQFVSILTHWWLQDNSAQFVFLDNYILFTSWGDATRPIYVYNRATKAFVRSKQWTSGNYSWKSITQTNYLNERLFPLDWWYVQTSVWNIETDTTYKVFNTNYHQASNFWDLTTICCENGGQNFYMYDSSGGNVRPFSWSNYVRDSMKVADSWLVERVSTSDWEYDKTGVCWCRNNSTNYVVTHAWVATQANSGVTNYWLWGMFVKYDSNYAISWNNIYYKGNNSLIYKFWQSTGWVLIWITSSWNISFWWIGIKNISWWAVYTDSNFVAAISGILWNW